MTRYSTAATPDRPEFEIRADGVVVDPLVQRDVVEIDVAEEVGRHGRAVLLLQNWDPDTRTVRHSDDGPFPPGTDVTVLLGYHSTLAPVFDGVVVAVTAHFPDGSRPVLRVEARSRSILLDHVPRSRHLAEVTDGDVATTLAADHGLTADTAAGVTRAAVVSDRRPDWDLLTARAEALGWVLYVRDTTLVFRPPAPAQDPVRLEYGRDVTELHLTQDLTRAVDPVVAAGWDTATLEPVEAEAGPDALHTGSRPDHGAALHDAGWPLRTAHLARASVAATDAAEALAVGRQRTAALGHVHGTGVVVGNPDLRCDTWLSVTGVGDRFSGEHYVTAARHRVSARGYRTEFQVGRPPALTPRGPDPARPTRLVTAVVDSLEDPEGLNRVRVRPTWRGPDGPGVWARLVTLDAGDGYGTVVVPDVGQEVLLGTLDGDDDVPVVLGALVNAARKPPVTATDTNAVRAVVTPDGHTIRLTDGEESGVSVQTPAGHRLHLSEKDSEVTLTHGDSGNAITLSGAGIELVAAQGDLVLKAPHGKVTVDATGIEGRSTGPAKLESSATFDISATAALALQGALITIN